MPHPDPAWPADRKSATRPGSRRPTVIVPIVLLAVLALTVTTGVLVKSYFGDRASSSPTAPPAASADAAIASLPPATAAPAIEDHGTVGAVYHQTRSAYLGELTLWLACAGFGEVTLAVSGVPAGETGSTEPRKLTDTTATCADRPTAVKATFLGDPMLQNLVVDLSGTNAALHDAGFAYRITSDTGAPLTVSDYNRIRLSRALRLNGSQDFSVGSDLEPGSPTGIGELQERGSYTVAVACAGAGRLEMKVGRRTEKIDCSWTPRRHDFPVSWTTGRAPAITVEYRSLSAVPARWAAHFLPR